MNENKGRSEICRLDIFGPPVQIQSIYLFMLKYQFYVILCFDRVVWTASKAVSKLKARTQRSQTMCVKTDAQNPFIPAP